MTDLPNDWHIEYIFPPIPLRDFDWCVSDDEGLPIAYGRTEEMVRRLALATLEGEEDDE